MNLRRHQAEFRDLMTHIFAGYARSGEISPREIIASVTPGGGKSALPVGLAHQGITAGAFDRVLWVVPRNSLRTQGEREFLDPRWHTPIRLRAARNDVDPARGTEGYITTYQAIGTNPGVHHREFQKHRYALFLDEPHHVVSGGQWERSLRPLVKLAKLVVYASGTLERGDSRPIAFISEAAASGAVVISYTRADALADDAIVPIRPHLIDGDAEWREQDGEQKRVDALSTAWEDASAAVFTALRTEFARELLNATIAHWMEYRRDVYPDAKLLVVSPDIEHAELYLSHVRHAGVTARIATSSDSPAAQRAIDEFRRSDELNCLVTVAMAYEGLSVPRISHIACLTHIRSKPWLEQCFARANRLAPGKTEGHLFAPADPMFTDALWRIENGAPAAIKEPREPRGSSEVNEAPGTARSPWTPIASSAHVTPVEFPQREQNDPYLSSGLTPGETEKLLRQHINSHVAEFLSRKRAGSKHLWQKKVWRRVKEITGGKLADQSPQTLVEVWTVIREEFAVPDRVIG